MKAIDTYAQDFLQTNPEGEVVIYVLGDFTSLNPYSQLENGEFSFEALKIFKMKGYTVLFTPGNHDAFDWTGRMDGSELFIQQMHQLHQWGIPILASNLKKPKKPFSRFLVESYKLKTLATNTHILGMTLETLYEKSNLVEIAGKKLFSSIEKYEPTLKHVFAKLKEDDNVVQVFIGIHHGHKRLSQLSENLNKNLNSETPFTTLLMGADDHLVTAYKNKHTFISDAGSHGSFNVIDVDKSGHIALPILHVAFSETSSLHIKAEDFEDGQVTLNTISQQDIDQDLLIGPYDHKLQNFLNLANENLEAPLAQTRGIETHKRHMKTARTELGSTLAEALVLWTRSLPVVNNLNEPIIAMVNSSSYRIEDIIPPGPMTERIFREMYPFLSEATVYRLKGKEIEKLFFSLRKHYALEDETRYSPQLNFNVRENNNRLQIKINGEWQNLKRKTHYLVAIDGWLSEHRYGQGFRIKAWKEALMGNKNIAADAFQEVLVRYMPQALTQVERNSIVDFKDHISNVSNFLSYDFFRPKNLCFEFLE